MAEKFLTEPVRVHITDEVYEAEHGYILDIDQLPESERNVKTAADGKTVLIPQPTDDPNDPLNWPVGISTRARKTHRSIC
jgi:hypothetical protein